METVLKLRIENLNHWFEWQLQSQGQVQWLFPNYQVLGVDRRAPIELIKKAYRAKVIDETPSWRHTLPNVIAGKGVPPWQACNGCSRGEGNCLSRFEPRHLPRNHRRKWSPRWRRSPLLTPVSPTQTSELSVSMKYSQKNINFQEERVWPQVGTDAEERGDGLWCEHLSLQLSLHHRISICYSHHSYYKWISGYMLLHCFSYLFFETTSSLK